MESLQHESESNTSKLETQADLRSRLKTRRAWFFFFFIVSGFCGLVYEVVWIRLAMASFGVNTAMVSIVIAMFMAGLGFGSWLAGRVTRRGLSAKTTLKLYGLVELLIGVSSLTVPFEFKLGRQLLLHAAGFNTWQSSGYFFIAGIWVAITLIPWCTFMGATFPVLMEVIRRTEGTFSEQSFSFLYIANVIGALLGTLLSAYVLIELFGFSGTLRIAGCFNLLLAILAAALSSRMEDVRKDLTVKSTQTSLYGPGSKFTLICLFATGMVTMAVEVVWVRQYTPYLSNAIYTFALILAVYLFGTLLGSRDYRSWSRLHKVSKSSSTWGVLVFCLALPVFATDPTYSIPHLNLSGFIRLLAILPFCALTGFLTPLLVDSWSNGNPDRAGTAYAVNIAGCIVGPLIAGFGLLPFISERGSVLCLLTPLVAIAFYAAWKERAASENAVGKKGLIKVSILTLMAMLVMAISHDYYSFDPNAVVLRDSTATVMATGKGFDRRLFVNGMGMTTLDPITKYIAHLTLAAMQRPPKNGLVICFGMGTSFRSMISWGIPTTAVELVPSVPKLFGYYHSDAPQILHSPLAHVYVDDGRRFLDGSSRKFDVIVVDPPPPVEAAGSSLLFSKEFYSVAKRHLSEDGVLQMWYPASVADTATTAAVAKAIEESFPYVRAFRSYDGRFGIHFLASMYPLNNLSSTTLAARMPKSSVHDFVEWGPKKDARDQFELVISREISLQSLIEHDPHVPAISDNTPMNEYFKLREWFHYYR